MSGMAGLRQTGTPFDGFLYAKLGEDRTGSAVSVLSALARLGLDPWQEAERLSVMSRESACGQLGLVLARFHDVPALGLDPGAIILRLVDKLPGSPQHALPRVPGMPVNLGGLGPVAITIALMVVLFVAQVVIFGMGATGN